MGSKPSWWNQIVIREDGRAGVDRTGLLATSCFRQWGNIMPMAMPIKPEIKLELNSTGLGQKR